MAQPTDDMVVFNMPDGTKVSNDPRFDQETALEEALASRENTGDIGVPDAEQAAQTQVEHLASPQSSQPGVGDNAVDEDPVRSLHGPLGSPAQQRQKEDAAEADEVGATPYETSVDDDEPVDSNEQVLAVREEVQEAREKALKAQEKLGDEGAGDPEQPYSEWSAAQLRHEAMQRNAAKVEAGDPELDLAGVKKKSQLAALLDQDDEASGSQS